MSYARRVAYVGAHAGLAWAAVHRPVAVQKVPVPQEGEGATAVGVVGQIVSLLNSDTDYDLLASVRTILRNNGYEVPVTDNRLDGPSMTQEEALGEKVESSDGQ